MLRRAPSHLASAISAFADGRHRAAMKLMDGMRAATPGSPRADVSMTPLGEPELPERMIAHRLSANLSGLLAHYLGEHEHAADDLGEALRACEAQSRAGQGHDSYVDLSGVLIDLAVNDVARGETERATGYLKRARYMAIRAYRPDARVLAMCAAARAELSIRQGDRLEALRHSIEAVALPLGPGEVESGRGPVPGASPNSGAGLPIPSPTIAPIAPRTVAPPSPDRSSDLRVHATASCVRSRCLRLNGLHTEALDVASSALRLFEEAAASAEHERPLPLLHARLLTADALARLGAGCSTVDARLGLQHAHLLLAHELGDAHVDVAVAARNSAVLRRHGGGAVSGGSASHATELADLPMLAPGLGLADDDPLQLAWRPVGGTAPPPSV
mmetsp:Transcript_23573/g.69430  ORF Transcript_23573/g.69430 Transcript_23573/m.69430 type:complete len:388 (-) Transcript_23573:247-1410(-)